MSSASELRAIALAEFARAGYAGTSIARIADVAGLSKSAVLYHYSSKEALLEAAIGPAVDGMAGIVEELSSSPFDSDAQQRFLARFIDFLLAYRLELHMFINQGPSLIDVPVVERANDVVRALADFFASRMPSTEDKMRFGIALGGAAYSLSIAASLELDSPPEDETRQALNTIMTELLTPSRGAAASALEPTGD